MKSLISGQNTLLNSTQLTVTLTCDIGANWQQSDIDPLIFLLTQQDKVRCDEDFIFYNQPTTPNHSIALKTQTNTAIIDVNLDLLDEAIQKIVFCLAIDGEDTFRQLTTLKLSIENELDYIIELDQRTEKSLILGQCYRYKDQWKFRALGQGYNQGLYPLVVSYGVEVEDHGDNDTPLTEPAPEEEKNIASPTEPHKNDSTTPDVVEEPQEEEELALNLEDDPSIEEEPIKEADYTEKYQRLDKSVLSRSAVLRPLLIPFKSNLEKYQLSGAQFHIAFVLEATHSMSYQFIGKNTQVMLSRTLLAAEYFNENGEMELWAFAERCKKYQNVTLDNQENYINNLQSQKGKSLFSSAFSVLPNLGIRNNEVPVMEEVLETFKDSTIPVVVVFITDGHITQTDGIRQILTQSTNYPIFWKFIGLCGSDYDLLEELNKGNDPFIHNTHFFRIDHFRKVSNNNFYDNLFIGIKDWLEKQKTCN